MKYLHLLLTHSFKAKTSYHLVMAAEAFKRTGGSGQPETANATHHQRPGESRHREHIPGPALDAVQGGLSAVNPKNTLPKAGGCKQTICPASSLLRRA